MNHARAKHLYPARVLTGTTAFTTADGTVYIHLGAGFGEGEVATTEAHTPTFTEELARSPFQAAFEIRHRTILIYQQAFNLMEHGLVRCINSFITIHFP